MQISDFKSQRHNKMSQHAKWRGSVSAESSHTPPNHIFSLYKNFFNFHKYFPTLTSTHGVSGVNCQVGCIRYCIGSSIPSSGEVSWSKERLLEVNENEMSLKYEIVESNIGFEGYVAVVKVAGFGEGCVVEWMFEVEPVVGLTLEELVGKYERGLRATLKNMEDDYLAQV